MYAWVSFRHNDDNDDDNDNNNDGDKESDFDNDVNDACGENGFHAKANILLIQVEARRD